jgi:hypothetical protein
MKSYSKEMQDCIRNCSDCHTVCIRTVNYCLKKGGEHAQVGHITILLDCADICATSANFMSRLSNVHQDTCALCAQVCSMCAVECESLNGEDEQIIKCVEVCRACAESCEVMATELM